MYPESVTPSSQITPVKLMEQLRGRIRVKHYSIRTEQAYVDWVRRFILFHGGASMATQQLLDLIGNTTAGGSHAHGGGQLPLVPETRIAESRRFDQGSHRALDDRGGGARRPAQARRHDHRGHRRQYRAWAGARNHHRAGNTRRDQAAHRERHLRDVFPRQPVANAKSSIDPAIAAVKRG